jgi:hypothetical protein
MSAQNIVSKVYGIIAIAGNRANIQPMTLKLVARLAVIVLTLCLLLCGALLAFGARQPAEDEAWTRFGFLTCELPCFAGITPGSTDFGETSALLTEHIPALDPRIISSGSSVNFFARVPTQLLGGVVRYQSGGQVGEIRINAILPIERLMAQLGTPDCILVDTASTDRSAVIFWERGAISIAAVLDANLNAVRVNTSTFALWLRIATPPDCALRGARAWRGFAPLWAYKVGG